MNKCMRVGLLLGVLWQDVIVRAQSGDVYDKALLSLQAPVARVTGPDVPYPMSKLENYYMPNQERIIAAIEKTMVF